MKMTRKSLYVGVLGFALGCAIVMSGVIYYLEQTRGITVRSGGISVTNELAPMTQKTRSQTDMRYQKLLAENHRQKAIIYNLKRDIEALNNKLAAVQTRSAAEDESAVSDTASMLADLTAKQAFAESEKYFSDNNVQLDGNVQQALNTAFMKETLDPSWAFEQETAIETRLSDAALEDTFSLISRDCRTNQCRITYLGDNTQAHSVFGLLNHEQKWRSYVSVPNIATGTTEIYLQRFFKDD